MHLNKKNCIEIKLCILNYALLSQLIPLWKMAKEKKMPLEDYLSPQISDHNSDKPLPNIAGHE